MNKSEFIARIAEGSDLTKAQAGRALNAALESITDELSNGGSIALIGFGTFAVKARPARQGRNPQNGQPMDIKASKLPTFKPGQTLKAAIQ